MNHKYLTNSTGEPLKLIEDAHEPCPQCTSGQLWYVSFVQRERSLVRLHCVLCDYHVTKVKPVPLDVITKLINLEAEPSPI